jgi:GT2 family glycosyltransferase
MREIEQSPACPRLSVVVLTYNRRKELMGNLARLRSHAPGVPVYVVDNGSSDGTADAVAAAFPDMTLVRAPANMGAAGRNLGVAAAGTPYIAFCDDDTCWEASALDEAERMLDACPRAGVISACVHVGPDGRVDPACELMSRSTLGGGPPGTVRLLGFMAGACIVRRQAYLQAGGYEPRFFIGGEEALLALDLAAAGWHILYAPHIRTWHWPSPLRDRPARMNLLNRNAIWTAWLRLPWLSACRETGRELRAAARRGKALRVAIAALQGIPWVLRHRKRIPSDIERQRQLAAAAPPLEHSGPPVLPPA